MSKLMIAASVAALSFALVAGSTSSYAAGCNVKGGAEVTQNVTTHKKVVTKASGLLSSARTDIGTIDCGTVSGGAKIKQNINTKKKIVTKASGLLSSSKTKIGTIK